MKSFVTLSDIHYPYHDPDVHVLLESFLSDFHPDELYLNGDIWDMPTISKYHPRRQEVVRELPLQEHIDSGREGVATLIDCAQPRVTRLALGNHEARWDMFLGSQARALASLRALEFDKLLGLDGIEWKEYGDGFWINDSLFMYHGSFVGSNAMSKERQRTGASTITGHGHTQTVQYHSDRSRAYKSIAEGCLCSMTPPYSPIPPNWQQGFVMGWVYDDEKFRAVEVEIVRGKDELWMAPLGQRYSTKYGSGKVVTK